jgi:hypothetical protein
MSPTLASISIEAIKALSPAIVALIGWLGLLLEKWLRTKIKNEQVQGIMVRLNGVMVDAVKEVEQTYVTNLDSITPDALTAAKDKALATVKAHLGDKGLAELKYVLGLEQDSAVERLLISVLEARVYDLKNNNLSKGVA